MPRAAVRGQYTPTGEQVYREVSLEEIRANPDQYEVAGPVRVEAGGSLVEVGVEDAGGRRDADASSLAAEFRAQGAEASEGGLLGQLKTAGEGLATGGSAGLYDLYRQATGTAEEKAAAAERAELHSGTRLVTEIAGGFIPLTPGALLARQGARIASLGAGKSIAKEVGARAAGAALESVGDSFGQYVAAQALKDEPLSVEGIAASMGVGALVGGGIGGGLAAAGRGLSAVGKRLERTADPELAGIAASADVLAGAAPDKAVQGIVGEAAERLAGRADDRVPLADLTRKAPTPAAMRKQAVEVVSAIDDADTWLHRARQAVEQVDTAALRVADPALATKLDEVVALRSGMQREAVEWGKEFAEKIRKADDLKPKARAKAMREILDEVDERGVRILGDLDDAQAALDDVLLTVEQRTGMPMSDAGRVAAMRPEVVTDPGRRGFADRLLNSQIGNKVQDVVGAVEVAQSMGLPVPDLDSVPLIGPVLSAYAKARFVMGKFGVGASTRATNTAQKAQAVASLGRRMDQLGQAIGRGGPLPTLAGRVATRAINVAAIGERLSQTTPGQVETALQEEVRGLPPEVAAPAVEAARRKVEYLRANFPQPPASAAAFGRPWRPSSMEARRAQLILDAMDDPAGATAETIRTGQFSSVTKDVLRSVYPQLWEELRATVVAQAPEIHAREPLYRAVAIGHFFDAPTAPQLMPGVQRGLLAASPPPPPPSSGSSITYGQPSAVSQNAQANERTLGRSLPR